LIKYKDFSYEKLKFEKEGKEMKKCLIGGLVLCLLLGGEMVLSSCGDNGGGDNNNQNTSTKTVAAGYTGEFWTEISEYGTCHKIIISEKEIIYNVNSVDAGVDITTISPDSYIGVHKYTAWTVQSDKNPDIVTLKYAEPGEAVEYGMSFGTFYDFDEKLPSKDILTVSQYQIYKRHKN